MRKCPMKRSKKAKRKGETVRDDQSRMPNVCPKGVAESEQK